MSTGRCQPACLDVPQKATAWALCLRCVALNSACRTLHALGTASGPQSHTWFCCSSREWIWSYGGLQGAFKYTTVIPRPSEVILAVCSSWKRRPWSQDCSHVPTQLPLCFPPTHLSCSSLSLPQASTGLSSSRQSCISHCKRAPLWTKCLKVLLTLPFYLIQEISQIFRMNRNTSKTSYIWHKFQYPYLVKIFNTSEVGKRKVQTCKRIFVGRIWWGHKKPGSVRREYCWYQNTLGPNKIVIFNRLICTYRHWNDIKILQISFSRNEEIEYLSC